MPLSFIKIFPTYRFLISLIIGFLLLGSPYGLGGKTVSAGFLRNSLIVMLLCVWLIYMTKDGKRININFGIEKVLILFLIICGLSYILSPYKFSTQIELVQLILYISLFYISLNIIDEKNIFLFLKLIVVGGLCQAVFCIGQYLFLHSPRATGMFFNPNLAATYLLAGFSVALAGVFTKAIGRTWRWFFSISLLFFFPAMGTTGSRSLGIAMISVIFSLVLLRWRKTWAALGITAFALLAFLTVPNPVSERMLHEKERDIYAMDRLKIWSQSLKIIRDHPITGVSLGNFEYSTYQYRFPVEKPMGRYEKIFKDPHNSYLEISAELGILGALCLVAIIAIVLKRFYQVYKFPKLKELRQDFAVFSSFLILIALAVQAFFHDVIHSPPNVIVGVLALATIGYNYKLLNPGKEGSMKNNKKMIKGRIFEKFNVKKIVLLYSVFSLVILFWPVFCLKVLIANRYYESAFLHYAADDWRMAEEKINKAIFYNAGQPFYYKLMGDILIKKYEEKGTVEDIKYAEKAFVKAISTNKMDPSLYYNLGNYYFYLTHLFRNQLVFSNKAIEYYKKAVELSPFNVRYRIILAIQYIRTEKFLQAKHQLERCLELEPNFLTAKYLLRNVYQKLGSFIMVDKIDISIKDTLTKYRQYIPKSNYEKMILMDPKIYFMNELGYRLDDLKF